MVPADRKQFTRGLGLVLLALQFGAPAFQTAHEALHHRQPGDIIDVAAATAPFLAGAFTGHSPASSTGCAFCRAATRDRYTVPTGEYQLHIAGLAADARHTGYHDVRSRVGVGTASSRAPPLFS